MSPRITPVTGDDVPQEARPVLDSLKRALGMVPNLHQTLARSPAALKGYVATVQALAHGRLPAALREQIAVAVAGYNRCAYCASAHTMLGKAADISPEELARNLAGASEDDRVGAALHFARRLVEVRGSLSDDELAKFRAAGFDDAEIVEVVAHVGLNWFTNIFNILARPAIDFPKVELAEGASR